MKYFWPILYHSYFYELYSVAFVFCIVAIIVILIAIRIFNAIIAIPETIRKKKLQKQREREISEKRKRTVYYFGETAKMIQYKE